MLDDREYLSIEHVQKAYGDFVAVRDLSLSAKRNELVSLLGPSGCGKTTTLRMIAGFFHPDRGEIFIDGEPTARVPSHKRETAMVFQNYALFPHMSIIENVAYGLKMRGVKASVRRERAEMMLSLVRLPAETYTRFPTEISGGQQQRVALARALVVEPKLLLLDEPLSNLDAKLRKDLRIELREIHDKVAATTVFVTHDLEEAFELSDKIAVMNGGRVEQVGSPADLYARPASEFVADFVGHSNIFAGGLSTGESHSRFVGEDTGLTFDLQRASRSNGPCLAVIPEGRIKVSGTPLETDVSFSGTVVRQRNRGHESAITVRENGSGSLFNAFAVNDEFLAYLQRTDQITFGWHYSDVILVDAS